MSLLSVPNRINNQNEKIQKTAVEEQQLWPLGDVGQKHKVSFWSEERGACFLCVQETSEQACKVLGGKAA